MKIVIHELTGQHRTWERSTRTLDRDEAVARTVAAHFGRRARFIQNKGFPYGYGSIVKVKSASGSAWSAAVVINHVRVDVSGGRDA